MVGRLSSPQKLVGWEEVVMSPPREEVVHSCADTSVAPDLIVQTSLLTTQIDVGTAQQDYL